jgi:endonuclease-3
VELKVEHATPERGARGASTSATRASPGAPPFAPPGDWPEVLRLIKQMRAAGGAPVDTMGCEKISEDAAPDAKGRRFVTLVSAMLSSQTKDPITHAATARLVAFGCTPEKIAGTSVEQLDALITPVGFHQRKAGYLKAAAAICVERYDSDIPPSVETLTELPGVGPKMAYLVMNVGWGKASGICVDVHVHRIAERMGWVPPVAYSANGTPRKTRNPEDTRVCLESWLPEEEWVEINPLLVGHGQLTCTPRAPKCGECLVNALCPSAFAESKPDKERRARGSEK